MCPSNLLELIQEATAALDLAENLRAKLAHRKANVNTSIGLKLKEAKESIEQINPALSARLDELIQKIEKEKE